MQLYVDSQFASPYAMSAFVGMNEKALEFDLETVDLAAEDQNTAFVSRSITRRVPMLVHNGFALASAVP